MTNLRLDYPLYEEAPVMQGYGDNPLIYARFGLTAHNGIDLGVYAGTPVLAMAAGTILFAGDGFDYPIMGASAGNCVVIEHSDGYRTAYAHLLRAYGENGYQIAAGEVLGLSGATGAVSGDHLHIEVLPFPLTLDNGYMGRIDPRPYFKRGTPLYTPPSRRSTPLPVEQVPPTDTPTGGAS
jgi:murein DD-endopeptidase MepM/ murein hydrolase activator NlpD